MAKVSRRDFLIGTSRLAAASLINPLLRPGRTGRAAAQDFPAVAVAEGTNEDTPELILQTALRAIGGMERFVKPGQTVAIKPNATWAYPPHTASSTDPDFLAAVILAVQNAGAGRIIVMDHCSIEPGADEALQISGIGPLTKKLGVERIFPDRFDAPPSTYTKIDLPYGKANQRIGVIKAAMEVDVRINLAVAKTHNVTRMSLCLKHMMGFLQQPGLLHANLEQGIADINTPSPVQAQLHLLEAIRVRLPLGNYQVCAGPETDLSHPKIVARRNMVLAGNDPALLDAYGAIHLFDLQPQEVPYLLRANESGVGNLDVEGALSDGRIRVVKVGEPAPEPTAANSGNENTDQQPAQANPTSINIPAAESIPPTETLPAGSSPNCEPSGQVINPGPLLNTVLIPIAAILTGIGLAILNRARRKLPKSIPETGKPSGDQDAAPPGKDR